MFSFVFFGLSQGPNNFEVPDSKVNQRSIDNLLKDVKFD
jgi:hypothetical protein